MKLKKTPWEIVKYQKDAKTTKYITYKDFGVWLGFEGKELIVFNFLEKPFCYNFWNNNAMLFIFNLLKSREKEKKEKEK